MSAQQRSVAAGILLVVTAFVYLTHLGTAPMYLMHDEVNYSLQAQSLADTARDTNGRLLPLYFAEAGFEAGRDPLSIYATALLLKVRPLSESTVRMPTAVVGILCVFLMWLLACRLFEDESLGLLTAAMLAMTPGLFVNSRLALSIVYPVPFVLGWLLCMSYFVPHGAWRPLMSGAMVLGLGVYSYLASVVMMPIYLASTAWVLRKRGDGRRIPAILAAFAAALVPLLVWQLAHPNRYQDLISAYRLFEPADADTVGGLSTLGDELLRRVGLYWNFFDPTTLFLSGGSRMTNATRVAGIFPLAFACLVPLGVFHVVRAEGSPLGKMILAGFLTSPAASVLSGRLDINRVLFAIPFGVILAAYGVASLRQRKSPAWRWGGIALLATIPLQFAGFYSDYMGRYRLESGSWFGGNVRGAVEAVLERNDDRTVPVFLNRLTPIERYWRFYALARGRADLVEHPVYYNPAEFSSTSMPSGSLLVCETGSPVCLLLVTLADWRTVSSITEPDGVRTFEVFERL